MKRGRCGEPRDLLVDGLDGHGQLRIEVGGDLPQEGVRVGRTLPSCGARCPLPKRRSSGPRRASDVDLRRGLIGEALAVSDVRGHADDGVPTRSPPVSEPNAPSERAFPGKQDPFGRLGEHDRRLAVAIGLRERPAR